MGLVSYLKDLYYNSRLNKANKLLFEGRASEAEKIYISILDSHPMAIAKLAEYYHSLLKSAEVAKVVSLFEKVISLESKGGKIYDANSYNKILSKFVDDIISKAKRCFDSSKYEDCSTMLEAINKSKCRTENTVNLCCESDINILLHKINNTKYSNKDFSPLLDNLMNLWRCAKQIPNIIETLTQFCDKLCKDKRHYVSALVLGIVKGDKYHKECLHKVALVVSGEDSEINAKTVKDIIVEYGKQLVLLKGQSIGDATSIFDKCWKCSTNCGFVVESLNSATKDLRESIVSHIISDHKAYLSNLELFKGVTKWISETYSDKESIAIYEKVHSAGYNVEEFYVKKVHALIANLPYNEKVELLNKAYSLYPKSKIILDDMLCCAKWFEQQGDNAYAIRICDSIISDCQAAKVIKAKTLCNLGNKEQDIDKKVAYIEQATAVLASSNEDGAEEVNTYIQHSLYDIAEQYYSIGGTDKSYTILDSLAKQGYKKAIVAIIIHRIDEIKQCADSESKLKGASKTIDEINAYNMSFIVSSPEYCTLWSEKINAVIELSKNKDNNTAIIEFEQLINAINAVGFDNIYVTSKCTLLLNNIIEKKYIIARELEKGNRLNEAATTYKEINALEKKRVPTLSALRFMLCKLKLGNISDILQHKDKINSLLKNASQAFKAEKDDIAYRFALALLKAGEDKEALSFLADYLPYEIQLKKACEQGAMIKAQAKLDDFNQKLEAVKNKTLSSDDAIYFINHMLEYAEIIKPILDLPRTKLSKYRAKLKNYAIFKLFDEGKFDAAFKKMIKEHSDYLEDLTALRNIALICLNIAEAKQLKKSNYQEVISVWLTAIYQERLFVKSLDYTSWDDQYQFTLQNAYGHFDEFDYDDLPDNVNFDDPEDNSIISIREVQRVLLNRFEAAITDTQLYHEFFTSQKDAMDALIELNLDEKCTLVVPFLATKDEDIFDEISEAFDKELECQYDNWEDVLSVGVLYDLKESIYCEYSTAKDLFSSFKKAIENKNNVRLFTSSNVAKIKKFNNLFSSFTSFVGSKVSALKSDNRTSFKSNFDFFSVVCASVKNSAISFTFSNYVMHYIVVEVKKYNMKHAEASKFILSVFLLDTSNSRVKENLTALVEMLSRDKSTDASTAVNEILSKVQTVDATFYRKLKSKYDEAQIDKELNDIVDKVNNHTMSEAQALSKVFTLYQNNSNSERVCENLAQLCDMCIMKYIIQQENGGSSVAGILDSIYTNMSSEFKKHRDKFAESYRVIWGQLPYEAKETIQGLNPNATLNDSGRALKRGLNYYKEFGGVTESSFFSDIFGLGGLGRRKIF